jgi:peptidoglycan/LPS O-acetylase OafA/YrhL
LLGTILHPEWRASRMLECGPLRWLGRLSYSLYLWQQLFVIGSQYMIKPFPMGHWQEFPLNVAAALAMASVSYYLIERPMIAWGGRLAKGVAVPEPAPSAVLARV